MFLTIIAKTYFQMRSVLATLSLPPRVHTAEACVDELTHLSIDQRYADALLQNDRTEEIGFHDRWIDRQLPSLSLRPCRLVVCGGVGD